MSEFTRIAVAASLGLAALGVASGIARADEPSPGDFCAVLHATTADANGDTMWCNPMMTGTHALVWQYGGPA
jgi:hypothetical protein